MEVLPNIVVSAELVVETVEGCALASRVLSLRELMSYTQSSERATREAVKAAVWLGIVRIADRGYTTPANIRGEFPASKEKKVLLFREYLQKKNAFVQFATFLSYREPPASAADKVRVLYEIGTDPDTILKLFVGWGKSAGLFEEGDGGLRMRPEYRVPDLPVEYLDGLKEALGSDMRARIFVARKLADETFRLVPEAGVDRAVRALRGIGSDPRNSVEDVGELLEDFLRVKAQARGVSATGASGIGGMLEVLVRAGFVTTEQETIGAGLNTLRIMAAHPTRAKTGFRWIIKQDSGLETVLLTLSLMRSIHEYDSGQSTIF